MTFCMRFDCVHGQHSFRGRWVTSSVRFIVKFMVFYFIGASNNLHEQASHLEKNEAAPTMPLVADDPGAQSQTPDEPALPSGSQVLITSLFK